MSESTPEPPRRRRRWWSISLRALMLLILVVGLPMGWKARKVSLQKRAVARIERLRGAVDYDWQVERQYIRNTAKGPKAPLWLRETLGDEYFQDIVCVRIPVGFFPPPDLDRPREEWESTKFERAFDADQLACLDGLDRIERLNLCVGALKPEALARLEGMSRLKDLTLIVEPLDADGLAHLGRMSRLESLCFALGSGPGADLAFLDRLPNLRRLQILRGAITETGLARIGRLKRLESLSIDDGSKLTDATLSHLKESKNLRVLKLRGAGALTRSGLATLEGLTELRHLNLSETPGDDDLLDLLRKLPKLRELALLKRTISDKKIEELRTTNSSLKLFLYDEEDRTSPFDL
jgi:hypothetical protein